MKKEFELIKMAWEGYREDVSIVKTIKKYFGAEETKMPNIFCFVKLYFLFRKNYKKSNLN